MIPTLFGDDYDDDDPRRNLSCLPVSEVGWSGYTVSMQILTQVAYAPGGNAAARAPSTMMLTLGINVLPAFLDFKMRTTPEEVPADYYGFEAENKEKNAALEHDKDKDNSSQQEELEV
jgi:hypothetical protein